jgi:cytochrome c peroxidase
MFSQMTLVRSLRLALALTVVMLSLWACTKETYMTPVQTGKGMYVYDIPEEIVAALGKVPEPADNPTTAAGVELGRRLFYDNRLSTKNDLNCGSCHKQVNGFADDKNFSVGHDGALSTRSALPLVNLAYSKDFFWDGRRKSIESTVHDPVVHPDEMANKWTEVVARLKADDYYSTHFNTAFGVDEIDSVLVTKALAQFVRSLVSFNAPYDRYKYMGDNDALTAQQKQGEQIFLARCSQCHSGVLTTDNSFRNNGLNATHSDNGHGTVTGNVHDNGKFRVTSLRNITTKTHFMHNSAFSSVSAVMDYYSTGVHANSPNLDPMFISYGWVGNTQTGGGQPIADTEQAALVAFMSALTDERFLTNPNHAKP